MKSGIMTVHHNKADNFIDDPYFFCIADDSYVNTRVPTFKQVPPRLEIHNCMEDQTTTCSPESLY